MFPTTFSRANLTILTSQVLLIATVTVAAFGETKMTTSDGGFADRFGCASAVSGEFALIGAQADDDRGGDSGAAYVFDLTTCTQVRKLTAIDGQGGAYFGCSVALADDAALVGALRDDQVATDVGAAYLFNITTGAQLHKLTPSDGAADDWFGKSVAVSPSYALVGAYKADKSASSYDSGKAYLFDRSSGAELFKLEAGDAGRQDWFGHGVALSETYALVGAPTWDDIGLDSCGAVYVFDVTTGTEQHMLMASDAFPGARFGNALAVSGDYAVIGAYWDNNANGSSAGAVYVFDIATGAELHKLIASDGGPGDWFGCSVAAFGDFAVIGANQNGYGTAPPGKAYLFNIVTGQELIILTASDGATDDNYGVSVGVGSGGIVVGADKDDDLGMSSGSAYEYDLPCTGDLDGDRSVTLTDLASLLSDFDCTAGCVGDTDGDDDTDLTDLALLLAHFDQTCP